MKSKLVFGLGGALMLVAAVLSALAWTPVTPEDRAAIEVSSDNQWGE